MKTDRYTKLVLTIIAVCLVWMSLGGPSILAPAHAQAPAARQAPQRVYIAGWVDWTGNLRQFGGSVGAVDGVPVTIVAK